MSSPSVATRRSVVVSMGGIDTGVAMNRKAASVSAMSTRTGPGICTGPNTGVNMVAAATRADSSSVPTSQTMSMRNVIGS
jgi:hypothetical protein